MLPRITRAVAGLAMTIVMTSAVPTRADQTPTIDEATFLRSVLERSPRHRIHEARRRAADAAVGVALVLPNPTLSYEREAVPRLDTSDDFIRLGWSVDLAGRRGLAGAAARAGADAERASVERDALLLEIEARTAYLEAARARVTLQRLDEARVSLAEIVDALKSRAARGDASNYDAERATLELDTLDDERADARRALQLARMRLGGLMGEPAKAYDATDAMTLPARPADGPLTPKRSDVDAARARANEADRELVAARRSWIPRFEVVVGMLSSRGPSGDGIGYIVGIGGDVPLFDAGGAKADRSRADVKRWQSEADALAIQASAESEQARSELIMRIDQAAAYAAGPAKRAIDLQRRATVTYREGDRPILELLDVHRAARQSAVRALDLVHDARRAELAFRGALGKKP